MARQIPRREVLQAAASSTFFAPALLSQVRRKPNILLLFPDQHRTDFLGGNPRVPCKTPTLDQLGRSGTRFLRAIAPSPLCATSRACLASGREYYRCGVRSNQQDYPLDQPTVYLALRDAGYHVMGCGKLDLHKATLDWGIDGRRFLPEWGFSDGIDNAGKLEAVASGVIEPRDPYMAILHRRGLAAVHVEDFRRRTQQNAYLNTAPTPLPEELYCDNWIGDNAIALLRRAPANKPWFLQVNFTGAHNPVDITRSMERSCRSRNFKPPIFSDELTPDRHNAIRQNYAAMVENVDRLCGSLLDEVRRRGELANTLVIYSSDHGEMLGDHQRWGKGVPYQQAVHIPLILSGPGVPKGVSTDSLVSLIDVTATILSASGARMTDIDGLSLEPLLSSARRPIREYVRSSTASWKMVFDGRFKFIQGFEVKNLSSARKGAAPTAADPRLLFDLKLNPEESTNMARQVPQQVARLGKLLR